MSKDLDDENDNENDHEQEDAFVEDRLLATFDLKQRGWTASMIQKLLPEHDDTRENRLNKKYGRVKLYWESRVQEAESTGAYAELLDRAIAASERSEKARQTRARKRERQIQEFLEDFAPQILPVSKTEQDALGSNLSRKLKGLWDLHEWLLSEHIRRIPALGKLTREERKNLATRLNEKYLESLKQAYPELEWPEG